MRKRDIAGMRFGRLVAISSIRVSKYGDYEWLCECDCGNTKIARLCHLQNGNIQSCGCFRIESARNNLVERNIAIRYEYGVAAQKSLYRSYKNGAVERDLEFSLPFDYFVEITSSACQYCGIPPSMIYRPKRVRMYGEYNYNGIDRIDNSRGYIIGNCVPCCKHCNYAKHTMTLEEFKGWVFRVYAHMTKDD